MSELSDEQVDAELSTAIIPAVTHHAATGNALVPAVGTSHSAQSLVRQLDRYGFPVDTELRDRARAENGAA